MNTRRVVDKFEGFEKIEMDCQLYLEPELVPGIWGEAVLKLAVARERSSGVRECTHLNIKIPRDTVTRMLHEIRKLHVRERAQIAEDIGALNHE